MPVTRECVLAILNSYQDKSIKEGGLDFVGSVFFKLTQMMEKPYRDFDLVKCFIDHGIRHGKYIHDYGDDRAKRLLHSCLIDLLKKIKPGLAFEMAEALCILNNCSLLTSDYFDIVLTVTQPVSFALKLDALSKQDFSSVENARFVQHFPDFTQAAMIIHKFKQAKIDIKYFSEALCGSAHPQDLANVIIQCHGQIPETLLVAYAKQMQACPGYVYGMLVLIKAKLLQAEKVQLLMSKEWPGMATAITYVWRPMLKSKLCQGEMDRILLVPDQECPANMIQIAGHIHYIYSCVAGDSTTQESPDTLAEQYLRTAIKFEQWRVDHADSDSIMFFNSPALFARPGKMKSPR